MEQEDTLDFKALRAKFQQENALKIQSKPAIPEKPKVIPPPTSPTHSSLISSINCAMENRMAIVPRVVFKDEKKDALKRQLSHSAGAKVCQNEPRTNPEPSVKPELLDLKQKKEADIFKQALKDKKLPLVLPVASGKVQSPEPTPALTTPTPPAKTSTPKKKSIFTFKKSNKAGKEKADAAVSDNSASLAPDSATPAPDSRVPVLPIAFSPAPSKSAPASSETPAKAPVAPKALTPPIQTLPAAETILSTPAPAISPPVAPEPENPAPSIPATNLPSLVTETGVSGPEVTSSEVPDSIIQAASIPDEIIQTPTSDPPVTPDSGILDLDIPPPIIPDNFIPEEDVPVPAVPSPPIQAVSDLPVVSEIAPDATPDPSPPVVSQSSPPIPVNPEPLAPSPVNLISDTIVPVASYSPTQSPVPTEKPTIEEPVPVLENGIGEQSNLEENIREPEPRPLSALSALERAEEMSPGKRTPPGDQRVFNLLEKAKRKYIVNRDVSPPPLPEPRAPTPVQPASPTEPTEVGTLELPPIDYEDLSAEVPAEEPGDQQEETAQVNGLDHTGQESPIQEAVPESPTQVPQVPPPPPPKKPLPAVPATEEPHSMATHVTAAPAEENDGVIPAPLDFASDASMLHASEIEEPSAEVVEASVAGPQEMETIESPALDVPDTELSVNEVTPPENLNQSLEADHPEMDVPNIQNGDYGLAEENLEPLAQISDSVTASPVSQEALSPSGTLDGHYENCDNVYEDLAPGKNRKNGKKTRKGPPKNPYADTQSVVEETPKKGLFSRKSSGGTEEKELKKKEKQREKEREKEKEKERKEQKEREKKENEMKKKFKIKGEEEAIYQAKAMVTIKGRKNDLAVKSGDTVSIIRTTNCPKGKWLAKDCSNNYGYIALDSVELDVQGMMELGKKAKTVNHINTNNQVDGERVSNGSRSPNHYNLNAEYFSDDSEEWACDDDETQFAPAAEVSPESPETALSETVTVLADVEPEPAPLTPPEPLDQMHMQARQEALQKLATFFKKPTPPAEAVPETTTIVEEPEPEEESVTLIKQEAEAPGTEGPELQILPPPALYADSPN